MNRINPTLGLAMAVLLGALTSSVQAQNAGSQTKPDNSSVNKRDRQSGEPTADQQKEDPNDRKLTADIRRSIVSDKSLSTYAHNVKIITQNGVVTLKGPVRSEEEAKTITDAAAKFAGGSDKVVSELSVAPKQP